MSFIIKQYKWLLLLGAITLSGCGFHLQHTAEIPAQFKTLSVESGDPYGELTREVRSVLIANNVKIIDNSMDTKTPSLRLMSNELTRNTISIYQDGKAAEYQLILTVDAQVVIAGQDIYPITVKIFRTFFDNPATALAKDTEQTLIKKEMYQQAALQIVRKLKSVDVAEQKLNSQ